MSVSDSHNKAMEFAERALMARVQGNTEESTKLFEKALENELEAIRKLEAEGPIEPTYSVLHRSAGTLALDCNQPQEAEEIVKKVITQDPPQEIADELHELRHQISLFLHSYWTDINIWNSSNFRVPSLVQKKELGDQGVSFWGYAATSCDNNPVESIAEIDHEAETLENRMDIFGRLLQPQSTGLLLVRKGGQQQPPQLPSGEYILAAQTATLERTDVIVAPENVKHLSPFVQEDLWYNTTLESGE